MEMTALQDDKFQPNEICFSFFLPTAILMYPNIKKNKMVHSQFGSTYVLVRFSVYESDTFRRVHETPYGMSPFSSIHLCSSCRSSADLVLQIFSFITE